MSDDLPDDWYEEHDGQRLVLSSEKVAAGISAAVAAERERCAKIALVHNGRSPKDARDIAAKIRMGLPRS